MVMIRMYQGRQVDPILPQQKINSILTTLQSKEEFFLFLGFCVCVHVLSVYLSIPLSRLEGSCQCLFTLEKCLGQCISIFTMYSKTIFLMYCQACVFLVSGHVLFQLSSIISFFLRQQYPASALGNHSSQPCVPQVKVSVLKIESINAFDTSPASVIS